ncbi:MAG TPA: hypothetical protein VHO28_15260, partial [Ignavibacteriales bacterium]|nr:hypothetical protein [Ignavibacteriales bacterium]
MKIKDAFPKIISSFFSLIVLTLFSIGCSDSSTENGPTGDVYEDRLLYINALDHKLYTCDINGVPSYEGEMLDDLDYLKFSHSSFNIAKKKIVYYSADSGKVFIRNFDGSGRIAVNVDLSRSKDFDLQWMPDNEHVLCSINGKFFKFDFEGKNLTLLNELPDTVVPTGYCRSYNFHFSSGGKFAVEYPRLTLVCNADASIYREYIR